MRDARALSDRGRPRTLPNAGDSIDEQLLKLVREHHPEAQTSIHMIREWKEKWSFVGEAKQPVLLFVPVKGKATDLDITAEMRAACESILAPVCETMLDLLTRVEPEYQAKVRNNVILAGGTSLIVGLSQAIEQALASSVAAMPRLLKIRFSRVPMAAWRSPRIIELGLGKVVGLDNPAAPMPASWMHHLPINA